MRGEYKGLILILIASMVIGTSWWNIDYTFHITLGKLGYEPNIGVPFLGIFTAGEWWNLNAVFLMIGVILAGVGSYIIGHYKE